MTDATPESTVKALEFNNGAVLEVHFRDWSKRAATVEDIVRCLLANPEARMAVLERFLPPDWVDRDQALSAPTDESGKDSATCSTCHKPGCEGTHMVDQGSYDKGVYDAMHGQIPDYSCGHPNCERCQPKPAPVAEAPSFIQDKGPINEASVSEAPERVTHSAASESVSLWAMVTSLDEHRDSQRDARNLLRAYIAQQEQSEREVARLRTNNETLAETLLRSESVCNEELRRLTEEADSLRTQLTDANLKAEGLREDNEEMRKELKKATDALAYGYDNFVIDSAKLTAAERKAEGLRAELESSVTRVELVEALEASGNEAMKWLARELRGFGPFQKAQLERKGDPWKVSSYGLDILEPASTEPAGVEAGKPDPRLADALANPPGPRHARLIDPTPTEPEAPDKCPTCSRRYVRSPGFVRANQPSDYDCPDKWHEPADPAPPKPGAAKLTGPVEGLGRSWWRRCGKPRMWRWSMATRRCCSWLTS